MKTSTLYFFNMIHSLKTAATFPISGAILSGDFQPQTGITAVVGENGVGKTFMSVEATRWLLFGKAALRGLATDYKDASVIGEVSLRGAHYQISRGRHEWVKDASGAVIAKGAEKVTEKIVELMGYPLDVFDLCNAATQGNVQRLGNMRASERKAIIDKVLRLTDAEKAEKDCREEAKGYRREAEALAKTLRDPGPAPQPGDDIDELKTMLRAARSLREQWSALQAKVRLVFPPKKPDERKPAAVDISLLEKAETERLALQARHDHANRYAGCEQYTAEQIEAAKARAAARKAKEARGDAPTMSRADVDTGFAELREHAAHKVSEPVECPECGTRFRPTGESPPEPRWSRIKLETEDARLRAWLDADPDAPLPDGIDLTHQQLIHAEAALQARQEAAQLPRVPEDRSDQLARLRASQAKWRAYEDGMVEFQAEIDANNDVQLQIKALGPVSTQESVDRLADAVRDAEIADAAYQSWERDDTAFRDTQAKITEASRLADEYRKGAEGVADARAVVKALIAPKISTIATALIRDMSMGKLRDLIVDDDMEITVGGQRIETLSGAGKTVANLALRIAMGQALVGRVFPVFLADEIDGDLSASRRAATLQALVALKQHLQQIILVTHRGAEIADHVWNVE